MEREQVLALAPDTASIAAAKKLESPAKWERLSFDGRAIWGLCKGSGKKPYQTRIDLKDNASKCTCPSRKFPCKHALALFLLYVEQQAQFNRDDAPDWVREWLDSRDERNTQATAKASQKRAADPHAQQKRQQKREDKIHAGLQELQQWLKDAIRVGVAELPNQPYRYWDDLAARMVDAQAPGLASWIKRIGGHCAAGESLSHVVGELANLYLFIQAYQRQPALPELANDLKRIVGINTSEAEVMEQAPLHDHWWVFARRQSEEDSLIMRSTWLLGTQTGKFAKIIQYAHVSQRASLADSYLEGKIIEGNVHFFPSATPLRCWVGEHQIRDSRDDDMCLPTQGFEEFARLRQRNPWIARYPLLIERLVPVQQQDQLLFVDPERPAKALRANTKHTDIWRLLAVSGGSPVNVLGEWDGECLSPLSVMCDGQLISLEPREMRA